MDDAPPSSLDLLLAVEIAVTIRFGFFAFPHIAFILARYAWKAIPFVLFLFSPGVVAINFWGCGLYNGTCAIEACAHETGLREMQRDIFKPEYIQKRIANIAAEMDSMYDVILNGFYTDIMKTKDRIDRDITCFALEIGREFDKLIHAYTCSIQLIMDYFNPTRQCEALYTST